MEKNKRILVIDNDSDILKTIKDVLSKNYTVETSMYAESGLNAAKRTEFNLILIDLHLGSNISGYVIKKRLKKEAKGKPKLVYITVIPKTEVDLTGIDGFIQKPFDIKTILLDVDKILNKR